MVQKIQQLIKTLSAQTHIPVWLIWVLIAVFILRIPSFFEPYWYGDEMIYLTLGEALRRGLVFYRDIHDNKPPLLYILAALSGNVFWFRVILAFWMLTTIYLFWRLARLLFKKNEKLVKIASASFALLTTIPLLEGNIANAEVFMIGLLIAAFVLLLEGRLTQKKIFLSGVLFSLATLFKVPAAFDAGVIFVLWLGALSKRADLFLFARRARVFLAGFLTPILLTVVYYAALGGLSQYAQAALFTNIGYLSTWREQAQAGFIERNAPLLARAGILILATFFLFWVRKRFSTGFFFASVWFLFSLFGVLLSERPYPHYLIQIVPSFSLLLAISLAGISKERFLPIPLFAILASSLIFYKFGYFAVFPYYQNFILWATGARSQDEYFAAFDRKVPRTYKVARHIAEHTQQDEPIFVWGNEPAIYALSRRLPPGRYTAAYHIHDFNGYGETLLAIEKTNPLYIVTIIGERGFPGLDAYISKNYVLVETFEDTNVYRRLSEKIKGVLYR